MSESFYRSVRRVYKQINEQVSKSYLCFLLAGDGQLYLAVSLVLLLTIKHFKTVGDVASIASNNAFDRTPKLRVP